MTKEQKLSAIRHSLSAIAGILISYGILKDGLAMETVGAVMALVSTVWSILDKTYNLSMIEGAARQVLTVASAYLATKMVIAPNAVDAIVTIVMTFLTIMLGQTDKTDTGGSTTTS
jgi:hypothetical protein